MQIKAVIILGAAAVLMLCATVAGAEGARMAAQDANCLFFDDFSRGMDNWWVEGGVRTWVQDGRLHCDTEPGDAKLPGICATIWCKQKFEGDIKIECDAHVLRSDIEVNNINFFFHFSDTSGRPIYETRTQRADGAYNKYHVMNGNIVTYLSDNSTASMQMPPDERPARVRIRHCPDFDLLNENFAYHCAKGRTYHIEILKQGTHITFKVNGHTLLKADDPASPTSGLFGLRTYRTYLWWDNIRISAL